MRKIADAIYKSDGGESGENLDEKSFVTIIKDSVATFEVLNDQISCIAFSLFNVKWSLIKKKLQQHFEEFIYVMDYQPEILNLCLNKCIFPGCMENYTVAYVKKKKPFLPIYAKF